MKFNPRYLSKITSKIEKAQSQSEALKKLGQKQDWKYQHEKCLQKVEEEIKFWESKQIDTVAARLLDLNKDRIFLKRLNSYTQLPPQTLTHLQLLLKKYNLF